MKFKKNFLNYFIIFFSIISYFILFFLKKYSIAGAQIDFNSFYFRNIQNFKNDFLNSIYNYGSLGDANYPFDYIFHGFLNPFSQDENFYLLSTLFIGFLTFVIFALALKKNEFSSLQSFSLASLILLLPWFSGRAYWGTSLNLGYLLLVIAFYFFINVKREKLYLNKKNIFFLCFFSSLALYTRNSFIFFPIYIVLYMIINKFTFRSQLNLILTYLFFSIPGLFLIFIWGDIHDTKNLQIHEFHNIKNILKNIPIILNYFFFYLWPIFLIQLKERGFRDFFYEYRNSFLVSFLFLIGLSIFGHLEYLYFMQQGGGVILELGQYLNDKLNVIFILTSSLGFSLIYKFLKFDFKNNIILLLPLFLIFGFPSALYQDYFEPLIFFLFFLGFIQNDFTDLLKNNIYQTSAIYFLYFAIYNFSALLYKNFIIS